MGRHRGQGRRLQMSIWDGATSPWLRASLHMSRQRPPVAYHRVAASGLRYRKRYYRLTNGGGIYFLFLLQNSRFSHLHYRLLWACFTFVELFSLKREIIFISISVYAKTLDYYPKQTDNAHFLTIQIIQEKNKVKKNKQNK